MPFFETHGGTKVEMIKSHRFYLEVDAQKYVIWNSETEVWELPAVARWYECGEVVSAEGNRLCTKLIGHEGEHGKRDDLAGTELPLPDARVDGP